MAVRMRKVLARPWVGVPVCYLLLSVLLSYLNFILKSNEQPQNAFAFSN